MVDQGLEQNKYRKYFIFIGFIIVISRFGALFLYDIWYDEGITFSSAYSGTIPVSFPPLYYLFMRGWTKLFGYSLFVLRLPSAIFSSLALFPFYFFVKNYSGQKTALLAAILYCFSPFQLWYGQEATPYALSLFLGMCSLYYAYNWYIEKDRKVIRLLIFFILFCFTDYINVVFCMPFLIYIIIRVRKKHLVFFSSFLVLFTAIAVFYRFDPGKIRTYVSWISGLSFDSFLIFVNNYFIGYTFNNHIQNGFLFLSGLILPITIYQAFSKKGRFLGAAFFIPFVLICFFSLFIFPIFLTRKLIVLSPLFYVLALDGIYRLPKLSRRILLAVIFATVFFTTILFYAHVPSYADNFNSFKFHKGVRFKYPYKKALGYVRENLEEGDIILYSNFDMVWPLYYYNQRWRQPVNHYYVMLSGNLDRKRKSFENNMPAAGRRSIVLSLAGIEKKQPLFINDKKHGKLFWRAVSVFEEKGYLDIPESIKSKAKKRLNEIIFENKENKEKRFFLHPPYMIFLDRHFLDLINPKRIWLISHSRERSRKSFQREIKEIGRWMQEHYVKQEERTIDGIIIQCFGEKM